MEYAWRTFAEWLSRVEEVEPSVNYAPLVGHNTIREAVMGEDSRRRASPDEIERMKECLSEAMGSGAFGLSTGLDAAMSAHFADAGEIIDLAKVAQEYGGYFAPHTRHHQNQWPADGPDEYGYGVFHAPTGEIIAGRYHGLLEAIETSRLANRIRLHIAHLTLGYIIPQPHPEFLDEAAARATLYEVIDKATDQGLDVTYDVIAWAQSIGCQVPILESFFGSALVLPEWLGALGKKGFAEKLKSRVFRGKVKELVYSGRFKFGMIHPLTDPYWMDCYKILVCKNGEYEGQTIGEIARERQPDHIIRAVYDESIEVVLDVLVEDPGATWALIIDKREHGALPVFLKHDAGMPCTDVMAFTATPSSDMSMYFGGVPPIAYGLYPHYIRRFVREKRVLSLEEAIRKATSVPAQQLLGLEDRGVIRPGAHADIVLFDFERIREGDDFLEPARPPEGIEYVLVNGTLVYDGMGHTGERPGKVLKHC